MCVPRSDNFSVRLQTDYVILLYSMCYPTGLASYTMRAYKSICLPNWFDKTHHEVMQLIEIWKMENNHQIPISKSDMDELSTSQQLQ